MSRNQLLIVFLKCILNRKKNLKGKCENEYNVAFKCLLNGDKCSDNLSSYLDCWK